MHGRMYTYYSTSRHTTYEHCSAAHPTPSTCLLLPPPQPRSRGRDGWVMLYRLYVIAGSTLICRDSLRYLGTSKGSLLATTYTQTDTHTHTHTHTHSLSYGCVLS